MRSAQALLRETLADKKVDDAEVAAIGDFLYRDGAPQIEHVRTLVEIYCQAEYGQAFEDLFFQVVEDVFLADGAIDSAEQFYLLKMLYSDHVLRDREREFLLKLKRSARFVSAEFEQLCDTALDTHDTVWDVGGRQTMP